MVRQTLLYLSLGIEYYRLKVKICNEQENMGSSRTSRSSGNRSAERGCVCRRDGHNHSSKGHGEVNDFLATKEGDSVTVVTVKIELPRSLHDFMTKVAALEGTRPEDWYVNWLRGDFEAFLDQLPRHEFDLKRLLEINGLRATLEDRSPSFVSRICKSD